MVDIGAHLAVTMFTSFFFLLLFCCRLAIRFYNMDQQAQNASNEIEIIPVHVINMQTEDNGVDPEILLRLPVENYDENVPTEDKSCSICLADYQTGEALRCLSCDHKYHKICIDTWLTNHHTCPLCKSDQNEVVLVMPKSESFK
eukprot:TRINITY_DN6425_c0_g1_i1.p1 TRINITY_DN6425_c0_g1~~TRINITY_DN6425_c0_g1_i1.p1  ORF type:complete len:144 (+),score=0.52 TRINITY_DN6425_c0_g1_i1:56-487(+)